MAVNSDLFRTLIKITDNITDVDCVDTLIWIIVLFFTHFQSLASSINLLSLIVSVRIGILSTSE